MLAETGDDTDHHSSPSPLAAGVANPAISRDEMKRVARAKTAAILAEEDSLRRRGVIAARRPLANYDKRDENQIIEASISRSEAADPTASESPAEDEIPSKPQAMDLETCSPELNRTLDVEATILSTGSTSTIDLDLSTGLHTQSGSSGGYRANPTAVTCGSKEAGTDASPTASANTLEEKYLCCRRCECPKYPLYFVISAGKDDICIDCKLEHLLEDTVRMLASQERAQVDEQLQSAAQGRIEQWANDVRPQYGGRPKFQCREQVFSRAICVIGRLLRDWHVVREKSLLTVHTSEHDCNIQLATPPPTAGLPTPDEGEGVEAGPDEASPHCGPELGSVDPKDYGGLACDQTTDQHHETQGELADDIHERSPEEIRADEQLMIHDRASSTDQSSQRRSPTPEEDFCRDETAMFPSSQLPGADEVSPNAFEAKEARSLKRKRTSKTRASKDERRRRKRTKLSKAQEALDRLVAASAKTGGDAASSDACDKTPAESNGVKWEASPGTSSYVGAPLDLLDGLEAVAVALREAQAVLPQDEYDALERRVGGAHFGNGEKVVAMIEGVFRLHNEWLGL